MIRDSINIVANKFRITIVILCIIPVLVLAGITFGDGKIFGLVGGGNVAEASYGIPDLNTNDIYEKVFTISTLDNRAINVDGVRDGSNRFAHLTPRNENDQNQHFICKKIWDDKKICRLILNKTNKTLYKSDSSLAPNLLIGKEYSISDTGVYIEYSKDNQSINIKYDNVGSWGQYLNYSYDNTKLIINGTENNDDIEIKPGKFKIHFVNAERKIINDIVPRDKPVIIRNLKNQAFTQSEYDYTYSDGSVEKRRAIFNKKLDLKDENQLFLFKEFDPPNNDSGLRNYGFFKAQNGDFAIPNKFYVYDNIVLEGYGFGNFDNPKHLAGFYLEPGWFINSFNIRPENTRKILSFKSNLEFEKDYKVKNFISHVENVNLNLDEDDYLMQIVDPKTIDQPKPPIFTEKNICSSSPTTTNKCLILTDQIFTISQDNSNLGLKAADYAKKSNSALVAADKNEFDAEQVFKYKAHSFNNGFIYVNGSNKVLTSINGEIKIVDYTGAQNQRFDVSLGPKPGTLQFKDSNGKAININSAKVVKSELALSASDPSQVFRIKPIFDTTNKTKCVATDNCILKDNQNFTLSTKGTNNSLSSKELTYTSGKPTNLATASLTGSPSLETDSQQHFQWKEYSKDRGYIMIKGTNLAMVSDKDPKSNKHTISFRELRPDTPLQIFNIIRGADNNSIQIFDKDLKAISLNSTSVIASNLVKNTSTQTFIIGDIIDTSLPCPATPTPQGCLIPKDKVFAIATTANNAIKIDKGTTPITAKYDSSDPLQALKWNELSFNKGNLTILGTNNALASVGGKLISKPFDKTSKEQIFTVIKGSTPDAFIFVDINGLAINIDQTSLSTVSLSRGSITQNLTVKDIVKKCSDAVSPDKCIFTQDQLFSLSNNDNIAIHVPDIKNSEVSAYIRNENYPEQMLKWEEDAYNKGHLRVNASINSKPVKSLASVGDKIVTQNYDKTKKEQMFEVTKVGNNYIFKDYQGKVIQISNGRIINSNYNQNELKQQFNINKVTLTNLCVKNADTDVNRCLMPDNRRITLANKDNVLIDFNSSSQFNDTLNKQDLKRKLPIDKYNLQSFVRITRDSNQNLVWDGDGYNRGFIKIADTDFVLESRGNGIYPARFNGSVEQLFIAKKGFNYNSFKILDFNGKAIEFKKNLDYITTKPMTTESILSPVSYQELYVEEMNLEWRIWASGNEADSRRLSPKPLVSYDKGSWVYLKFIDEADKVKYEKRYPKDTDVYIVSHGFNDTTLFTQSQNEGGAIIPDGSLKNNPLTSYAKTVKEYSKANCIEVKKTTPGKVCNDAIVLLLDWSNLAKGNPQDLLGGSSYVNSVAQSIKTKLSEWGLNKPKERLNVVGHSLGTYMANEIGREFGGINNIILFEPASDLKARQEECVLNLKCMYDKYNGEDKNKYYGMKTSFKKDLRVNKFTDYSNYSIAFMGRRSLSGNETLANTATESFWSSYDIKDVPIIGIHSNVNLTALAISNSNKLKLNGKETLTLNEYSSNTSKKYPKDNSAEINFTEDCVTTKLAFSFNIVLDCSNQKEKALNNVRYLPYEWKRIAWNNHNGIIVSKAPVDNILKNNQNISKYSDIKTDNDGNVQRGFVKVNEIKRDILR
jgi:hypothetical protein